MPNCLCVPLYTRVVYEKNVHVWQLFFPRQNALMDILTILLHFHIPSCQKGRRGGIQKDGRTEMSKAAVGQTPRPKWCRVSIPTFCSSFHCQNVLFLEKEGDQVQRATTFFSVAI